MSESAGLYFIELDALLASQLLFGVSSSITIKSVGNSDNSVHS